MEPKHKSCYDNIKIGDEIIVAICGCGCNLMTNKDNSFIIHKKYKVFQFNKNTNTPQIIINYITNVYPKSIIKIIKQ